MVETISKYTQVRRRLLQDLGREPLPEEIAAEMGLEVEKVHHIMKISQETISLETPVGEDEDDSVLMRRLQPNVGIEKEPEVETPGGVLVAIAENIIDFSVMYYDGEEWLFEWSESQRNLPELVEVSVVALVKEDDEKPRVMSRSFMVSFPRMVQMASNSSSDRTGNNER